MAEIRVLQSTSRCMQRLGYLKRLTRRVTALGTSSLENLGTDLTQTLTRKVRAPLTRDRAAYVRQRLYDRAYTALKKQVAGWSEGEERLVAIELQDLYLADPTLSSQTGKLVREDGRKYPALGVALGLIRAGTYSPNTRALSLLNFTPETELQAFLDYRPEANPMCLSRRQALLLLYAFLENDGEVIAPLLCQLAGEDVDGFTDRDAGDRVPAIYRAIIGRHRARFLSAGQRKRLETLSEAANSIEKWRHRSYTGGGARTEASSVRVEPYVDIGLLGKPDPFRYRYTFTPVGRVWAEAFQDIETDEQIANFLVYGFLATAARAWKIPHSPITDAEDIVPCLYRAWQVIKSAGGYAPIKEIALVAGITSLLDEGLLIETGVAREAIIAYQKDHPYEVRFTVNRLGVLAHARFVEEPTETLSETES